MSSAARISGWLCVAFICVAWTLVAIFLVGGWHNYIWETDCRKGNATFAFGQALFAAIGIASAVYTAWPRPTANAHGHCRVSRHLASGTACLSRDAGRPLRGVPMTRTDRMPALKLRR